jgi:hypothetical protein
MKKFSYTAMDCSGKEISGITEAESREGAVYVLKNRSLFPTSVNEINNERLKDLKDMAETSNSIIMRPIPPRIVTLKEGEFTTPEKGGMWVFSVAIFIFVMWSLFSIVNEYHTWKIDKEIKKIVVEECIRPEFRGK